TGPTPTIPSQTEKKRMLSKAYSFQTEIENLNRDKAARLYGISLIDHRIDEVTNQENTLEEDREKEILESSEAD
ncbi:hypothetical protein IFR05_017254, partial [Cadophora sp. M221]